MFLIVGLGNPGEEYEHTRHNAGFDAVDLIAEEVGARYWKTECGALTTKGVYRDHDLVLAKPQSYMNTSGGPVKQLMNAYGVDAEHLIVVHDELDIDEPKSEESKQPKKDAADDFAQATDRGAQAALSLVQVGLEKTQQAFN